MGEQNEVAAKSNLKRKLLYASVVPPLYLVPLLLPLYLLGVNVNIVRDLWYVGIFLGCILIVRVEKTPLQQIGFTRLRFGMSMLLSAIWEAVDFVLIGILPFLAIGGKVNVASGFTGIFGSVVNFALVGLAEETWVRGLLLRRFLDLGRSNLMSVVGTSLMFVLYHVPANIVLLSQQPSLLPFFATGMTELFVWSCGLALVVLKTKNIAGPIVVHGLDDILSKVIFTLSL